MTVQPKNNFVNFKLKGQCHEDFAVLGQFCAKIITLRVCPWENQAGGDTAQHTDFAQTWHKCWVWWVNDYGKNLGYNIIFSSS